MIREPPPPDLEPTFLSKIADMEPHLSEDHKKQLLEQINCFSVQCECSSEKRPYHNVLYASSNSNSGGLSHDETDKSQSGLSGVSGEESIDHSTVASLFSGSSNESNASGGSSGNLENDPNPAVEVAPENVPETESESHPEIVPEVVSEGVQNTRVRDPRLRKLMEKAKK